MTPEDIANVCSLMSRSSLSSASRSKIPRRSGEPATAMMILRCGGMFQRRKEGSKRLALPAQASPTHLAMRHRRRGIGEPAFDCCQHPSIGLVLASSP